MTHNNKLYSLIRHVNARSVTTLMINVSRVYEGINTLAFSVIHITALLRIHLLDVIKSSRCLILASSLSSSCFNLSICAVSLDVK